MNLRTLIILIFLCQCSIGLACEITPELWELTKISAQKYELEPELLGALIWQESRYCVDAVSPKGALGLTQLMPGTAFGLGVDPYNEIENIDGGARYLRKQYDTFKDLELALAAYNAGPQAVIKHGGVPPYKETQGYVRGVLHHYRGFQNQNKSEVVMASDNPDAGPKNTISSIHSTYQRRVIRLAPVHRE